MLCPLCGTRKARRGCPAVGRQICPVCCGTKRLVEIQCPADCPYLTAAREHPAAATVRRRQRDLTVMVPFIRDLNSRQADLFSLICTFLQRYEPADLQSLFDDDVAEAMRSLAATYETAARGIIYEQRPASLPSDRLVTTLRPLLAEAGQHQGATFERDAAVVLRRFEEATREARALEPSNHRAFLDILDRVLRTTEARAEEPPDKPASGLIVP